MATLGTTFVGSWLALRGGDKPEQQGPPLNAKSKDEENFIKYEQFFDSRSRMSPGPIPLTRTHE